MKISHQQISVHSCSLRFVNNMKLLHFWSNFNSFECALFQHFFMMIDITELEVPTSKKQAVGKSNMKFESMQPESSYWSWPVVLIEGSHLFSPTSFRVFQVNWIFQTSNMEVTNSSIFPTTLFNYINPYRQTFGEWLRAFSGNFFQDRWF